MNFFNDSTLSLQEAMDYYVNYVRRNNGYLSPEFLNGLKIRIIRDNSISAHANASVQTNTLNISHNCSIVTLFHELKHVSEQWEENAKRFGNWEYENDFDGQMVLDNKNSNAIYVKRGIHGRFIDEAVAELYASKIYWELCGNSKNSHLQTSSRRYYDEEIINFKKICIVLGLNENEVLNLSCKNNNGRKYLQTICEKLTGSNCIWDSIEFELDFIEMEKIIKLNHSEYSIGNATYENFYLKRENIKRGYNLILAKSLERNAITQSQYNFKLRQLADLDRYLEYNHGHQKI